MMGMRSITFTFDGERAADHSCAFDGERLMVSCRSRLMVSILSITFDDECAVNHG